MGDFNSLGLFEVIPYENIITLKEGETSTGECCPFEKDNTTDKYFLVDNLFSELTDDYQRALARFNLGISDKHTLQWGNIAGKIANQKDLVEFIENLVKAHPNENILLSKPIYIGKTSDIEQMSKVVISKQTINLDLKEFVYLYIADENARIAVDNIYGGFKIVGDTVIDDEKYYLYRSVNSGLGKLNIYYDKQ